MMHPFLFGMGLTLFAGLATGIGSCIAFFFRRSDTRYLAFLLGFSGGVMVYISLVELLAGARAELIGLYGRIPGGVFALAAFFCGIAVAAAIDKLVPSGENPHEVRRPGEMEKAPGKKRLARSGVLFALAIGIHNFPEGMAVFVSGYSDPATGTAIALAIAIHNIPEGITVSVPLYQATGSRRKAFLWSLASGLAEPVGALAAYVLLMPFFTAATLPALFSAVAGIMVFISFDELLPLAEAYGEHHLAVYGLLAGMFVMALSLL